MEKYPTSLQQIWPPEVLILRELIPSSTTRPHRIWKSTYIVWDVLPELADPVLL